MKSLLVECHHCEGSGKLDLPPSLAETLYLLHKDRGYSTIQLLARSSIGVKHTTLCNRLAQLETLGFASSHREGKNKHWRRK